MREITRLLAVSRTSKGRQNVAGRSPRGCADDENERAVSYQDSNSYPRGLESKLGLPVHRDHFAKNAVAPIGGTILCRAVRNTNLERHVLPPSVECFRGALNLGLFIGRANTSRAYGKYCGNFREHGPHPMGRQGVGIGRFIWTALMAHCGKGGIDRKSVV